MFDSSYNINDLKIKTSVMCEDFNMVDTEGTTNLFNLQCLSIYGCELWNIEFLELAQLKLAWRKSYRMILNFHPSTHNILLPQLMDKNHIQKNVQENVH